MPIILPDALPATRVLRREGLGVMSGAGLGGRDERPLRIALLNLMPNKATTETQIARMLGSGDATVALTLVVPDGYVSKSTPAEHMAAFYRRWSQVREQDFDGLIVTGAPVERLPFESVTYWPELTEILDWSRRRVRGCFFICWAAQAALHHFHGVPKHALGAKMFGVFRHRAVKPDAKLLEGVEGDFRVPVSRHTEVRAAELPSQAGLEVIAESQEAGLCLLEEPARRAVYMFNHLEYDIDTLAEEYRRDLAAGRAVPLPAHYFPGDDPGRRPRNGWRDSGVALFGNWIAQLRPQAGAAEAQQALRWLFPERPRPTLVGDESSELMLRCEDAQAALPRVLRCLADRGLSPWMARVERDGLGASCLLLRIDGLGELKAERIAKLLLRLEGVLGLAYRTCDGSGGLFDGRDLRLSPPARERRSGDRRGGLRLVV